MTPSEPDLVATAVPAARRDYGDYIVAVRSFLEETRH